MAYVRMNQSLFDDNMGAGNDVHEAEMILVHDEESGKAVGYVIGHDSPADEAFDCLYLAVRMEVGKNSVQNACEFVYEEAAIDWILETNDIDDVEVD